MQDLMEARRQLRKEGVKGKTISDISKQEQRAIRDRARKQQDDKIGVLLERFSGLKHIAGIRAGGKKEANACHAVARWQRGTRKERHCKQ